MPSRGRKLEEPPEELGLWMWAADTGDLAHSRDLWAYGGIVTSVSERHILVATTEVRRG